MKAATKFKVFCIVYVISRKRSANQRKKNHNSVYRVKSTCQNSTTSEHFQKWPKNQGVVLALSLSIIIQLIYYIVFLSFCADL